MLNTRKRNKKKQVSLRSKISEAKIRQIAWLFAVDLDASQIAVVTRLNRNTVNRYLAAIRERIASYREAESPVSGAVEGDESCFGARRVRGTRGRGARGKTFVFGLFKRNGRVYTEIVPDCSKATLQAIIRAVWSLRAVFILTAGAGTMVWWTWDTRSISGWNTATMSLPTGILLSMASKVSGHLQRPGWCASGGCISIPYIFI